MIDYTNHEIRHNSDRNTDMQVGWQWCSWRSLAALILIIIVDFLCAIEAIGICSYTFVAGLCYLFPVLLNEIPHDIL